MTQLATIEEIETAFGVFAMPVDGVDGSTKSISEVIRQSPEMAEVFGFVKLTPKEYRQETTGVVTMELIVANFLDAPEEERAWYVRVSSFRSWTAVTVFKLVLALIQEGADYATLIERGAALAGIVKLLSADQAELATYVERRARRFASSPTTDVPVAIRSEVSRSGSTISWASLVYAFEESGIDIVARCRELVEMGVIKTDFATRITVFR